jgi:hypothetical protein
MAASIGGEGGNGLRIGMGKKPEGEEYERFGLGRFCKSEP